MSLLWPGTKANPREVPRDCRGCHDYSQPDGAPHRRPAETCVRCHVLGSMQFELSAARVDPALEAGRAFRHRDHLEGRDGKPLACASCHASEDALAGRFDRRRKDEPPIVVPVADAALCARCHDGGEEQRERFNAGLTQAAERVAQGSDARPPRRFQHAQHMKVDELLTTDPASCARCHPDIARADALHLSERQLRFDGCSECHVGMKFELELYSKPSAAAATFVHAYHLGTFRGRAGLEEARERLRRESCAACHEWSAERESFAVKDFLAAPGRGHAGCVSCHSDWSVPRHGDTDSCAHCHAVEERGLTDLAGQATNRPRVEVLRARPSEFAIAEHAHRFVHGPDGADADCSACHVATLERAPSRLGTQPFRHDSHLPPGFGELPPGKADSGACTACHSSIAQAISTDGIVGTRHGPPGSGACFNFDRQSCERCHGAAAFAPVVAEPVRPASALAFDHRAHLNRRHPLEPERNMTCVDCHRLEAGAGDLAIVSDAKVANCTLCHGHDEDRAAVTLGLGSGAVTSCAHCHAPGIPARGHALPVERARLGAVTGAQVHAGTAACASCHRMPAEGEPFSHRAAALSRLAASWSLSNSPHGAAARSGARWPFFQDERACIDCHFGNLDKPTREFRDQFPRQAESSLDRVKEAARLRQESDYRARFGADLDGYPGFAPP